MDAYEELLSLKRKSAILEEIEEVLSWDQLVMMPKANSQRRGDQMALTSLLMHESNTNPRIGELIEQIEKRELSDDEAREIKEIKRSYMREINVSGELVEKISKKTAEANDLWEEAREKSDFKIFSPILKEIVELKKEYVKQLDPNVNPYQVLLQDFEEDLTIDEAERILTELKKELIPLVKQLATDEETPKWIEAEIDEIKQEKFLRKLLTEMTYDLTKGRYDTSTHPFTGCAGRITTRYTDGWVHALLSTIHEMGHAFYYHGRDEKYFGRPKYDFCSFGVHESQSRFWELLIGKSKAFWSVYYSEIKEAYAPVLDEVDFEEFLKGINQVKKTMIRVNADEVTYGLHIIIRYEMEKEIFSGELNIDDIPKVWNQKMKDYLGVEPENDSVGCLQDVHWSFGGFGYFPTYIYGSIMAAQIFETMNKEFDVYKEVEEKNFEKIKNWLTKHIHQEGRKYTMPELVEKVTGEPLSSKAYINYLKNKYVL